MELELLHKLNESQRQAVEYLDGPSLVIAGAGSGKTRVLTYKIAYLLLNGYKPWEIMALTFTNKAAKEMKERISKLLADSMDNGEWRMENGSPAKYLRMGTFHSVFAHILRTEADKLGYQHNFTIYDDADSKSLCKALIKELGLDDKTYRPGEVHNRISNAKNHLLRPEDYAIQPELQARDADSKMSQMTLLYSMYNQRCRQSNAMDFDDLLMNTYLLFKNNEEVRQKYATAFRFILVDEYQDTNYAQQKIIMQLAGEHKHICVVGDDAQSIYGFRGANIDNILNFQQQYQGTRLFKLEQNYRSTQRIVEAANSLIHKNERQIHKEVYSRNDEGENLQLKELASDREEAMFVSKDIQRKKKAGDLQFKDFAVLYRTNSQSRVLEEQMIKDGIPARVYGSLSFYARKEIKDIVAYLRIVANPNDEEALKRIINYPARGIGDTTVQKILQAASHNNCSAWNIIVDATDGLQGVLDVNKGTIARLNSFRTLIEGYIARLDTDDAYTLGTDIVKSSGISQDLYSSKEPEYISKQENMEEFVNSMREFVADRQEEGRPSGMLDYIQEVALLTDSDRKGEENAVKLMTIHAAKGLEFPCVFVVGMEENIFPSPMSANSRRELEEERRLLYVAITRAEKCCVLSYARMRYKYGSPDFNAPSRFLRDIDPRLISTNSKTQIKTPPLEIPKQRVLRPVQSHIVSHTVSHTVSQTVSQTVSHTVFPTELQRSSIGTLSSGDAVLHERFGKGIIQKLEGTGDSAKATVEFQNAGTKVLLLKFAKLQKI